MSVFRNFDIQVEEFMEKAVNHKFIYTCNSVFFYYAGLFDLEKERNSLIGSKARTKSDVIFPHLISLQIRSKTASNFIQFYIKNCLHCLY